MSYVTLSLVSAGAMGYWSSPVSASLAQQAHLSAHTLRRSAYWIALLTY